MMSGQFPSSIIFITLIQLFGYLFITTGSTEASMHLGIISDIVLLQNQHTNHLTLYGHLMLQISMALYVMESPLFNIIHKISL
uniref:Uncharacterized protein n=1 Tax=Arion vulgaris TaxID=1028688 RepID=A0A0B6ZCA1_9EUPU